MGLSWALPAAGRDRSIATRSSVPTGPTIAATGSGPAFRRGRDGGCAVRLASRGGLVQNGRIVASGRAGRNLT